MSLENETRAEFAARMDKEGNSRADMIAAYYGLLQWYRGKDDELQEAEAEVARLRAERDAARAAARAWKRKAYQWRNEAANALGLWPNVGWRVSELRRWYREYIR